MVYFDYGSYIVSCYTGSIPEAIDFKVFGGTMTNASIFDMLCGWTLNLQMIL